MVSIVHHHRAKNSTETLTLVVWALPSVFAQQKSSTIKNNFLILVNAEIK
uniref:Uncharacterized protein n=2 Tax=Vibrionaceae TaxID=641 RepID=A0A0H3ZWY5_VIBSP|nr:hypothetical protein [Vibrio splendidus]AKN40583.1 hypothetical protein [Enterovibrio norvegicus]